MRVNLPVLRNADVGRPKFRRSNPIIEGKMYQYRQPMHDCYMATVNNALVSQDLFTIPKGAQYTPTGGVAFAKNFWHTNMTQASLLPSPNVMFCKSISLMLRPGTVAADAERFLNDTFLTFNINERPFLQTHALKIPGGGGVYGGGSSAFISNGYPTRENQFAFVGELGETIEQGQGFNVVLDPTLVRMADATLVYTTATPANGGVGINAWVHLDGLLNRAVL